MARPDKEAVIARLADRFRASDAVLLTEYRGLSVADLKALRRSLAGNAEYTVVKNTLAAIAARRAGLEDLAEDFTGPSALAFVTGEPVEAAKALRSALLIQQCLDCIRCPHASPLVLITA